MLTVNEKNIFNIRIDKSNRRQNFIFDQMKNARTMFKRCLPVRIDVRTIGIDQINQQRKSGLNKNRPCRTRSTPPSYLVIIAVNFVVRTIQLSKQSNETKHACSCHSIKAHTITHFDRLSYLLTTG